MHSVLPWKIDNQCQSYILVVPWKRIKTIPKHEDVDSGKRCAPRICRVDCRRAWTLLLFQGAFKLLFLHPSIFVQLQCLFYTLSYDGKNASPMWFDITLKSTICLGRLVDQPCPYSVERKRKFLSVIEKQPDNHMKITYKTAHWQNLLYTTPKRTFLVRQSCIYTDEATVAYKDKTINGIAPVTSCIRDGTTL